MTTTDLVVVEHQGKSSVLRFYLHKMMGLVTSRSKRRPLDLVRAAVPFTLIFLSNFITRWPQRCHDSAGTTRVSDRSLSPQSRCKLKAGPAEFFPAEFSARNSEMGDAPFFRFFYEPRRREEYSIAQGLCHLG